MNPINAVDRVETTIIVDNLTDNLSSTPDFIETEVQSNIRRRGDQWVLSGNCLCCAAHGLSCLVTVHVGAQKSTFLFDTGPGDQTFEQNVSRLGISLSSVQEIVLSHGHWDHSGAMLKALEIIRNGNGGGNIPCHTHPDMYYKRALKKPNGQFIAFEDVPSIEQLYDHGATVVNTREPQSILNNLVYISGEILRVTPFEVGFPNHYRKNPEDGSWEPDESIMDERFVAINLKGKGLIVFSACSHAGIVNVMKHAKACFGDLPIYAVVGGFHLSGTAHEKIIPQTIEAMSKINPHYIAAGHCTGWRATSALLNRFGDDRVIPLSVGKRFTFSAGHS